MTSLEQTRAIHALRRRIPGYTDDDYRAFLQSRYGVPTSTRLTFIQAAGVIGELRRLAGPAAFSDARARAASGPYVKPLQALWIAAFNLGIVADRSDRALIAFVERQTGLTHTRFLRDAADAKKAIEGLKAWIARSVNERLANDGGARGSGAADGPERGDQGHAFAWPKGRNVIERKRAILAAQTAIVRKQRPTFDPQTFGGLEGLGARLADYDERALDRLSAAIGKIIRRAKAAEAKRRAA